LQFIKLLTGDDSVTIGDSLESETSDVQVLHFLDTPSGRNVTIVDTPGFGDSRSGVTDTDILQKIANYLLEECISLSNLHPLFLVLMVILKV
jgi:predicted GTPase